MTYDRARHWMQDGELLLGCYFCKFYQVDFHPTLGYCEQHQLDTNLTYVCKDMIYQHKKRDLDSKLLAIHNKTGWIDRLLRRFERKRRTQNLTQTLDAGILYAYIEVPDYDEPMPKEVVSVATFDTYLDSNLDERHQLIRAARNRASEQFHDRIRRKQFKTQSHQETKEQS